MELDVNTCVVKMSFDLFTRLEETYDPHIAELETSECIKNIDARLKSLKKEFKNIDDTYIHFLYVTDMIKYLTWKRQTLKKGKKGKKWKNY